MANFFQNIKAIFGEPAKPRASAVTINSVSAQVVLSSREYLIWVNDAYKKNEIVNGAINLIINTFIEAPLRAKDLDGMWVENDHPSMQLFRHINDHDTYRRFIFQLWLDAYLGDVAYIEKVFNRAGQVTELGLLRPDLVRVNADPELFIESYEYQPATEKVILQPNEVIPVQFIDPDNRFKGFSPLKSLAHRVTEDNAATEHSVSMLQNGGQPGSLLIVEGEMDPDEAEALSRSWSLKFKDKRNGSTAVLHGGMKYQPLGATNKDMAFAEIQHITEAKILSTLRVPLQVYGSITGSESSTFNNVKQAHRQFWQQAINPLQTMLEDALNNDPDLTFDHTITYEFDTSGVAALQEDVNELSDRCIKLFQGGLLTLNESREKIGYDEVEDGDEFFSTGPDFGILPEVRSAPEPEAKSVHCPDENDPTCPKEKILIEGSEACSAEGMSANISQLRDEGKTQEEAVAIALSLCEASKSLHDDEEDQMTSETQTEECCTGETKAEIDDQLADQLAIALGRESLSNRFLLPALRMAEKNLRRHISDSLDLIGQKSAKVVKQFEIDRLESGIFALVDIWQADLQEDAEEVLGALELASAQQAAVGVGVQIDIESAAVMQAVRDNSFRFADKVSNTSAAAISNIFRSGFEEGKGLGELATELRELGAGWSKTRTQMIARTETSRAANEGALTGYKESGVVSSVRWSSILDGNTSEICNSLNGLIIPLDGVFITPEQGFTTSTGRRFNLDYTGGGVKLPPAHPNCRSTIIPILSDIDE